MALVIGFPFILTKSGKSGRAWIQVRKPEYVTPGIEVYVNSVRAPSRIPIDGVPHARLFLSPLYARGLEVDLLFDGPMEAAELIGLNNSGKQSLDIDGPSSTLAQYLASELGGLSLDDASERRVLVSGKCSAYDGVFEIQSLGAEGRLQEKCDSIDAHDIWIHCDDFDGLDQTTQAKPFVRPFLAVDGRTDWLIEEFCQAYDLPVPGGESVSCKDEESPNERDLFLAAIDPLFFVERDERLAQYFSKYTARALLRLQKQALEPSNRGLFTSSDSPAVRHAFISGPTGCGKTTLV